MRLPHAPAGRPLLLAPTWLLLGVLVVVYTVGIVVFALAVVVSATLRLLLGVPMRAAAGLLHRPARTARDLPGTAAGG